MVSSFSNRPNEGRRIEEEYLNADLDQEESSDAARTALILWVDARPTEGGEDEEAEADEEEED